MKSHYLHRRLPGATYCVCGAHPHTRAWGRDCPVALREALAEAEKERDEMAQAGRTAVECAEGSFTGMSELLAAAEKERDELRGLSAYMRVRLLPALDAAGVRYDDPPEALAGWIRAQEERLDRVAGAVNELRTTLDNELGKGPAPHPAFTWGRSALGGSDYGWGAPDWRIYRTTRGDRWVVLYLGDGQMPEDVPDYASTAREAMTAIVPHLAPEESRTT